MRKRRVPNKSPERAMGVKGADPATYLAEASQKRIRDLPAGREKAVRIEGDTPRARWCYIAREMAGDQDWQTGVRTLALILHTAAEQQPTNEMREVADTFAGLLHGMVTKAAGDMGVEVTEDQADDISSSFFAAALDLVDTLPFLNAGKPS